MGKIIDTFGSMAAAREFEDFAMQEPILRIITEQDAHTQAMGLTAAAGLVSGRLIEPPADAIVHAAIPVEPMSQQFLDFHPGGKVKSVRQHIESRSNMLIVNPIHEFDKVADGVNELFNPTATFRGLTVVRHSLIMATLDLLEQAQEQQKPGAHFYLNIGQKALNGIWSKPSLKTSA